MPKAMRYLPSEKDRLSIFERSGILETNVSLFGKAIMTLLAGTADSGKERGRPRAFDPELALDNAMLVFRQRGFHAASIADLTTAMNLTAGSLYKAFKDKRTLFLQVFDRYIALRHAELQSRLAQCANGRARVAELLRFYLDSAFDFEGRRGCLVVGSATELQVLDEELSERVRQAVMRNKARLISMLEEGQRDGSVSSAIHAETAAGLILCITFGIRVVGKIEDIAERENTVSLALKMLD
ncbi:TetR family transcriptional regulator [Mixta calida B021323]|nr:TetR family transcriptional regulator [Mixta calida B021323]